MSHLIPTEAQTLADRLRLAADEIAEEGAYRSAEAASDWDADRAAGRAEDAAERWAA